MNHIKDQIRCGAAYRLGLTGKGIGVAVLDTGIFLHRDFDSRVTGFADMVNGKTFAYDDCGHGTHICGIIGGSGRMSGGPERKWIFFGCPGGNLLDFGEEGEAGDPDLKYIGRCLLEAGDERKFRPGERREPSMGRRSCCSGGGGKQWPPDHEHHDPGDQQKGDHGYQWDASMTIRKWK